MTGLLVVLVAALLALGGCAGAPPPPPPAAVRPAPAGTTELPVGAPDPADLDTSCDPTASLAPTGPSPGADAVARIVERGVLVVGVDQNTKPFGYRDPATGMLAGFDIGVAREMARALLGDPERIRFRTESSAQRTANLRSGEVDLVVQTMSVSCKRRQEIEFSSVYFAAAQRVLVPPGSTATGLADLGGRRVCTIAGSTSVTAIQTTPSRPIAVTVPEKSDCLVLLQQGQVDAITTDDTILGGFVAEDPRLRVVGAPIAVENYGIGVAPGPQDVDLVRFVNAVLDRMRADGTWARIYAATFPPGSPVPAPPVARYRP